MRQLKQPSKKQEEAKRHIMAPEVLDDRVKGSEQGWEVNDSPMLTGSTNHEERRMTAPLSNDTPEAASVRMHELLHARLTPANLMRLGTKKYGATNDSLQACEDARLNYAALQLKIKELRDTPVSEEQVKEILSKLCAAARAIENASSLYTDSGSRLYHKAACVVMALRGTRHESMAYEHLTNECGIPDTVHYQLHYAIHEMHHAGVTKNGVSKSPNATIRAALLLDKILERKAIGKGYYDPEAGATRRKPGGDPENAHKIAPPPDIKGEDTMALIDQLKVFSPALSIQARRKTRAYKRTSDVGTLFRPTEAMRLDGTGLPFRRKLKTYGCAILIDASGSMGFESQQLAEIIREVPGALVMLHASNAFPEIKSRGEVGTFAVVGKDGFVIDRVELRSLRKNEGPEGRGLGGGNANDAGAVLLAGKLANKARVKGPRFWVTDMGWGNHHGVIGAGNTREICKRAAKQSKFAIVPNVEDIWAK